MKKIIKILLIIVSILAMAWGVRVLYGYTQYRNDCVILGNPSEQIKDLPVVDSFVFYMNDGGSQTVYYILEDEYYTQTYYTYSAKRSMIAGCYISISQHEISSTEYEKMKYAQGM